MQRHNQPDVLFMDLAPEAYLMTNAKHCAPSTWDMTLYAYGFNDDFLLQSYFDVSKQQPTKIIYVEMATYDETPSIEIDEYNFTKYVKANYHLTYSNSAELFQMAVYSAN